MINAIIVDDEKKSIFMLKILLEENCPNVKVIGDANSVSKAAVLIEEHRPNLVFLDIDLGNQTGFDLLEKMRVKNCHIIFVTAHSHYAVKAFRFSVADFLLKPVDADELKEAVSKVKMLIDESYSSTGKTDFDVVGKQTLRIPSTEGSFFVYLSNIIRLEADRAYTNIYITADKNTNKRYVSSYNLKQFEEHLDSSLFMRVHRSHIINMKMIKSVVDENGLFAQMTDGALIEVSTRSRTDFLNRIH